MDPQTKELVALAASVAARCQPCFDHHLKRARELGGTDSDINDAISLADKISQVGGQRMMEFIEVRTRGREMTSKVRVNMRLCDKVSTILATTQADGTFDIEVQTTCENVREFSKGSGDRSPSPTSPTR